MIWEKPYESDSNKLKGKTQRDTGKKKYLLKVIGHIYC